MVSKTGRFQRADRLSKPREFQRVARCGRRIASRQFVILMAPSRRAADAEEQRLGVTVSRRVGNAVVRNRIKRAVREWFRHRRGELAAGVDLVVIARQSSRGAAAGEIAGALDELLPLLQEMEQ